MTTARAVDLVGGPALVALVLLLAAFEAAWPLRRRVRPRAERWLTNGAVVAIAALTVRLVAVPLELWAAMRAAEHGIGLTRVLPLPAPVTAVLAFLLLDYTTYVWHRLNHVVPFLWRFHAVHHTDLDLDVATAFRFHAGELLLSGVLRIGQVLLVGAGPGVVVVWEIVTNGATAFHHSNWRLPVTLERALVRVLVTPRMHGIHHSVVEREADTNWSVIVTWWDRLHRTLRLDVPQDAVVIGLPAYRDPAELRFLRLLALPFRLRPTWRAAPDS